MTHDPTREAPAGGYDGILLKFGDGTDNDTLSLVLGAYFPDGCVGVTLDDGTQFDATEGHFAHDDDGWTVFKYRHHGDDGQAEGPEREVSFDRVIGWEVY